MSKKISPVRLLSGTFCGDLFCNFRRLLVLVAMHITAPYIFMASYFMEITFFLNVSEILSYYFTVAFSGGVKSWKSSCLAVRKIQVSPRHISAYVCSIQS